MSGELAFIPTYDSNFDSTLLSFENEKVSAIKGPLISKANFKVFI